MQALNAREIALAQAALEHALYFLELEANERAAAYLQFAAQRLQNVVKALVIAECVSAHPALQPCSCKGLKRSPLQDNAESLKALSL